eukprot:3568601-Pleurochrysis_carterae.AAC.4
MAHIACWMSWFARWEQAPPVRYRQHSVRIVEGACMSFCMHVYHTLNAPTECAFVSDSIEVIEQLVPYCSAREARYVALETHARTRADDSAYCMQRRQHSSTGEAQRSGRLVYPRLTRAYVAAPAGAAARNDVGNWPRPHPPR